jgi:predicted branched-subunit amino acid permease
MSTHQHGMRAGLMAGLRIAPATAALAISFGVLARPVMGEVAPVVMSAVVFSGAAQFAALSVLAAGGEAGTAVLAGLLMSTRFLPMGAAIGPSLPGGALIRALQGQAIVDASFALAGRGDGSFDRRTMIGATIPQWMAWLGGTAIGVVAGPILGDPARLGLDALFAGFYLALLAGELSGRDAAVAAAVAAVIALGLMVVAPPGVPVVAASLAALIGLRRP